jgi:hypothetical protein
MKSRFRDAAEVFAILTVFLLVILLFSLQDIR